MGAAVLAPLHDGRLGRSGAGWPGIAVLDGTQVRRVRRTGRVAEMAQAAQAEQFGAPQPGQHGDLLRQGAHCAAGENRSCRCLKSRVCDKKPVYLRDYA